MTKKTSPKGELTLAATLMGLILITAGCSYVNQLLGKSSGQSENEKEGIEMVQQMSTMTADILCVSAIQQEIALDEIGVLNLDENSKETKKPTFTKNTAEAINSYMDEMTKSSQELQKVATLPKVEQESLTKKFSEKMIESRAQLIAAVDKDKPGFIKACGERVKTVFNGCEPYKRAAEGKIKDYCGDNSANSPECAAIFEKAMESCKPQITKDVKDAMEEIRELIKKA